MENLKVDSKRWADKQWMDSNWETGIYIRAQLDDGTWVSADIATLTKESLLEFLRSHGGNNIWAEDCVGILLGHGHLHSKEDISSNYFPIDEISAVKYFEGLEDE